MQSARRRHQALWRAATLVRDRKSTRLNSSHSQISYAVFCLKKKNNLLSMQLPDYQILLTFFGPLAPHDQCSVSTVHEIHTLHAPSHFVCTPRMSSWYALLT